tara:strand:- start:320 stop:724 length:405 start_codon:yes stop_codon:yes gene_type:complete
MAEKKEDNKNFDIKNVAQYLDIIKKYCLKLLKLDAETYFFMVPGVLLLVALLPVPILYFLILRIYLFVSALVLSYKFYIDEKDNVFAAIFAGIAIIYNPIIWVDFGNEEINTGPIIFVLTIALFVLGYQKIKNE